jgi:hypothetical protein
VAESSASPRNPVFQRVDEIGSSSSSIAPYQEGNPACTPRASESLV